MCIKLPLKEGLQTAPNCPKCAWNREVSLYCGALELSHHIIAMLFTLFCLICVQIWVRIPGSEDDRESIPFEAFIETLKWWQYASVEKKVGSELFTGF